MSARSSEVVDRPTRAVSDLRDSGNVIRWIIVTFAWMYAPGLHRVGHSPLRVAVSHHAGSAGPVARAARRQRPRGAHA